MSWCQDDFSYQWNIFKADILGLGPLLISPAPIPSCLNPLHSGPKASIVWLASALPNGFFSVHIPSSCGKGWWCQGAGGFQHPRLAGSARPSYQLSPSEKKRMESKAGRKQRLCWAEVSGLVIFFFLNTKLSDPEPPYLKINPILRLSSLCYQRTFYRMQLDLLF